MTELSPLQRAVIALKEMRAKVDALEAAQKEAIAIVGMGCRFPGGADNPAKFWQILRDGVDTVSPIPPERWDIDQYYDPDPQTPGKMYIREAALLSQVDQFDPTFFGISPREAVSLDPQQRLLLEVTWEALEDAAIAPDRLRESRTGVFVGLGQTDYAQLQLYAPDARHIGVYDGTGNGLSFAAGRLSYTLGLQGPNLAIDTACSSSLVAVHLACQSLRNKECDLALSGGVHLILSPEITLFLSKSQALAPDARCKTFDARADGYGRGEGCGVIVLKRLSDAQAQGDRILAIIPGSAVNHDGPSSGLTVPNKLAQEALLRQALANAKVAASELSYIEAHGTGTSLGDPIEVRALAAVLGAGRSEPLLLGAVKTNIGHLEAAAGIAGLIKVVLAFQHGEIPPQLHFNEPNPRLNWAELPFKVVTESTPWAHRPQVAGVSSFGMSGTNAHIILKGVGSREEGVSGSFSLLPAPYSLLTLSAKTEDALQELARAYEDYLSHEPNISLADVCYTANTGRAQFIHRLSVMAASPSELAARLRAYHAGQSATGLASNRVEVDAKRPKLAFLFTGQGAQYIDMGRELYETQPTFRRTLDRCAEILAPHLDKPLLEIMFSSQQSASQLVSNQPNADKLNADKLTSSFADTLNATIYTQPALFALEYALAELWQSWGVQPDMVMGHSVGEYVAACVAGVFSLEDGLKLIAARGRLMQSLPLGGQMVAVFAAEAQVQPFLMAHADTVSLAALNTPQNTVISGQGEAMQAIVAQLTAAGIESKPLQVSHAFHSPLMNPILNEFRQIATSLHYNLPQIPLISNLTGQRVGAEITTPDYWVAHVRQPVRFMEGLATLQQAHCDLFLEIGPKPTLISLSASQSVSNQQSAISKMQNVDKLNADKLNADKLFLASLRPKQSDWAQLLTSLGALYGRGWPIDWAGFYRDFAPRKIALPTYPFQRQRYWVERAESKVRASSRKFVKSLHPLLGHKVYAPTLKETVFETQFSDAAIPFLTDHRIYQTITVPGACHISLLLAAAEQQFGHEGCELRDIIFPQALVMADTDIRTVQAILTPTPSIPPLNQGGVMCQVISFPESDTAPPTWETHLTATLSDKLDVRSDKLNNTKHLSLITHHSSFITHAELYGMLERRDIQLGPRFRWIAQVWRGDNEVLGEMALPPEAEEVARYLIYPGLIDSCFQTVVGALPDDGATQTYIPFAVEAFRFYQRPRHWPLWCHARLRVADQTEADKQIADIDLYDAQGQPIAKITGFELRKVRAERLLPTAQQPWLKWLYEINWQPQPLQISNNKDLTGQYWLILADKSPLATELATQLTAHGATCYQANDVTELKQLLSQLVSQSASQSVSVLLIANTLNADTLIADTLSVVQALTALPQPPRLWIITQGAVPVTTPFDPMMGLNQTPLWGLARVIEQEHPELRCTRIDLESASQQSAISNQTDKLIADLLIADKLNAELQIAWRGGTRYVARLARSRWAQPSAMGATLAALGEQPFRLEIATRGSLDNLTWQRVNRPAPGPDEVEIAVQATGLNFRDVVNVLGMYDGDLGLLGSDCAGEVVAVGDNVTNITVGQRVMTMTPGSFARYALAPAHAIVALPDSLSYEEAATIPGAFLTAYYGLHELAHLKAEERVLIHAGAGGVGQAAIQLAQQVGAEIFVTASPSKWPFLQAQGITHIFNSRSLDFRQEILDMTQGQGVDVVLNSLNGEFIEATLAVVKTGGRFIEIGKVGVWSAAQVQQFNPTIAYHLFDLSQVWAEQPTLTQRMLQTITADVAAGKLKPLPRQTFPLTEVVTAFRYMQQAKHVGKIVVSQSASQLVSQSASQQSAISNQADTLNADKLTSSFADKLNADTLTSSFADSYLITGGLGGLGLLVAGHLVAEGARHLVLVGRRSPDAATEATLNEMRQQGATITVVQADVSQPDQVRELLANIKPPLRGIIHAAGVLDDGILQQQTAARFEKVMLPKVQGAWNLHQFSQNMPLDFFVMFSSAASLLGSAGQGNYAAANAFLDGLAYYRQARGLPALSINWGGWAEVGMFARTPLASPLNQGGEREVKGHKGGIEAISPREGLAVLSYLMQRPATQVGVLPMSESRFTAQAAASPFLENLARDAGESAKGANNTTHIVSITSRSELEDYIQQEVAAVLGWSATQKIDPRQGFLDLGMDSLTAVELRNRLQTGLSRSLPAALIFNYPTVATLTDYLASLVIATPTAPVTETPSTTDSMPDMDDLSQDELAALLAEELKK